MNLTWIGSPNFWRGRNGHIPTAIVDHIMEGTIEAANSRFQNADDNQVGGRASTHFGVAKDGRIWQWVQMGDTAWGNGIMQTPDMSIPWLADCFNNDVNPNELTISIEHEGHSGDVFTEAQYQATLDLHRFILNFYKIPADRQHIIGHYQIESRDRAGCPGPGFPWTRLMNDLKGSAMYDPNPDHFDVGQGMLDKMREVYRLHGTRLTAAGPETYLDTKLQSSFLFTKEGPILLGQQRPDSGAWVIRVLQSLYEA